MVIALIVALILIAILCVAGRLVIDLMKPPDPVGKVVWAIVVILALCILLNVFAPGVFDGALNLPRGRDID